MTKYMFPIFSGRSVRGQEEEKHPLTHSHLTQENLSALANMMIFSLTFTPWALHQIIHGEVFQILPKTVNWQSY